MDDKSKITVPYSDERWEFTPDNTHLMNRIIHTNEQVLIELSNLKEINKKIERNNQNQISAQEEISRNIWIGATILSCELASILTLLWMM